MMRNLGRVAESDPFLSGLGFRHPNRPRGDRQK
jgi:hypothetical protein